MHNEWPMLTAVQGDMKHGDILIARHCMNLKPHISEGPMQPGNRLLKTPRARFSGRDRFIT